MAPVATAQSVRMPASALEPDGRSHMFQPVRRWIAFIAIVVIGVAVSTLAYILARQADDARVETVLQFQAEWRARDFEHKLRLAADPIEILAPLIAAQDDFSPALFHRFVQLARNPGDAEDALIWAPYLRDKDRAPLVAAARQGGNPNFDILDLSASGRTMPATPRPEYLPIWLTETFGEARATPGLDLFYLPERRRWAEEARDTGEPVAAPFSPVLSNPSAPEMFLVYVPVYAGGRVPPTVSERQAAFRGLVIGRFRIDRLLMAAIKGTPPIVERIDFLIDADPRSFGPQQLAIYSPERHAFVENPATAARSDGTGIVRDFDLLSRHWTLISHFPNSDVAALRSSEPISWLFFGLLLTAALAFYAQRERSRRFDVEAIVASRTADLSRTVTELAAATIHRKQAEERLAQAQKMEAIGNLTGGMAHDFNNLLGVIIGNLDLLRRRLGPEKEVDELADDALQAALHGADLTQRLLAFARRQPLQAQRVDINELVGGVVKLLRRTLGEAIQVSLDLAVDVWPVVIDPVQLETSLTNIATNARDAMPAGGKLMIATMNRHLDSDYAAQFSDVPAGDYVLIEISDTGTGMHPETLSHIFEPFFTTKPQGKGTGLGLSMVFGFIKQSGGHINVYSEPGVGTTFRLYLRRALGPGQVVEPRPVAPIASARGETVLAVEDNAVLRRVVLRQLRDLGYRVLEADDAASALAVLAREKVDLMFTDIIMAGEMDGYMLALKARELYPRLRVVLTSGFPQAKVGEKPPEDDPLRILSKPYRREDLARALRDALDGNAGPQVTR